MTSDHVIMDKALGFYLGSVHHAFMHVLMIVVEPIVWVFGRVFHTVAVDSGHISDTVGISALTALTWNCFLCPHARVVAMTPSLSLPWM